MIFNPFVVVSLLPIETIGIDPSGLYTKKTNNPGVVSTLGGLSLLTLTLGLMDMNPLPRIHVHVRGRGPPTLSLRFMYMAYALSHPTKEFPQDFHLVPLRDGPELRLLFHLCPSLARFARFAPEFRYFSLFLELQGEFGL